MDNAYFKFAMLWAVAFAVQASFIQSADEWPRDRGMAGDGKSSLIGIRKGWSSGLRKVWETCELSQGDLKLNVSMSSPVAAGGVVVVMGRADDKDLIFAFDAEKGAKLWMKEVPAKPGKKWDGVGNGARATPVIEGDRVYTLGVYGQLTCWDLKTGNQNWLVNTLDDSKTKVPYWGVCGSPVIYGNDILVKVGGYDQGGVAPLVMAYDKVSGKLDWKSSNANGSWAPLAVLKLDGKDVLMAWASDGLKGLDPVSGKFLWNIPWKTSYDCHANLPAVEGSTLFLTSGYGTGCQAFEIKADKPISLWPVSKAVSACNSSPLISGGYVYSFSGNGSDANGILKCIELKTGIEKWASKDFGNGTLLFVDGCLLCLSYRGRLGLVEASSGAFKKLADMDVFPAKGTPAYAAPAIAYGKVYLRYLDKMVCYDLKN